MQKNKIVAILILWIAPAATVTSCRTGHTEPITNGKEVDTAKRPNIILIVADDLGYGELGCYGQQLIRTPNIDRLAGEGMRFTQFYAGTAVCAPSRASLMTGLHTGHTPIRGNREFKPEGQYPLPDTSLTIASVLHSAGYSTAAFGKWGLGYPGSTGVPEKKGFDLFFGYNCQHLAHNYYPDHLWENDRRVELPGNLHGDAVYSADLIHQHALVWLRQVSHKGPFFLFLPYTLPHASLYGPHDSIYEAYVKQFREKTAPLVTTDKKAGYTPDPHPHAAFAAMITRLDHYVGDIMRTVNELGIADNTLILFTSDNGPHREGGGDPDFFQSSGGLRGIKRDLYEGGIRVPLIAVWKGRIRPGIRTAYTGAFWDLFPTFEQLADIAPTERIDGLSFSALLGGHAPTRTHDYFYWEFHENNGRQAVRLGQWKGVRLNVGLVAHPPLELYDLKTDPNERVDVSSKYPDIVERIEGIMQMQHRYDPDWPLLQAEAQAAGKN